MSDLAILGVLTMQEDDEGSQTFALVSPQRMFIVLDPSETPRNWIPIVSALADGEAITILGVVADAGEM